MQRIQTTLASRSNILPSKQVGLRTINTTRETLKQIPTVHITDPDQRKRKRSSSKKRDKKRRKRLERTGYMSRLIEAKRIATPANRWGPLRLITSQQKEIDKLRELLHKPTISSSYNVQRLPRPSRDAEEKKSDNMESIAGFSPHALYALDEAARMRRSANTSRQVSKAELDRATAFWYMGLQPSESLETQGRSYADRLRFISNKIRDYVYQNRHLNIHGAFVPSQEQLNELVQRMRAILAREAEQNVPPPGRDDVPEEPPQQEPAQVIQQPQPNEQPVPQQGPDQVIQQPQPNVQSSVPQQGSDQVIQQSQVHDDNALVILDDTPPQTPQASPPEPDMADLNAGAEENVQNREANNENKSDDVPSTPPASRTSPANRPSTPQDVPSTPPADRIPQSAPSIPPANHPPQSAPSTPQIGPNIPSASQANKKNTANKNVPSNPPTSQAKVNPNKYPSGGKRLPDTTRFWKHRPEEETDEVHILHLRNPTMDQIKIVQEALFKDWYRKDKWRTHAIKWLHAIDPELLKRNRDYPTNSFMYEDATIVKRNDEPERLAQLEGNLREMQQNDKEQEERDRQEQEQARRDQEQKRQQEQAMQDPDPQAMQDPDLQAMQDPVPQAMQDQEEEKEEVPSEVKQEVPPEEKTKQNRKKTILLEPLPENVTEEHINKRLGHLKILVSDKEVPTGARKIIEAGGGGERFIRKIRGTPIPENTFIPFYEDDIKKSSTFKHIQPNFHGELALDRYNRVRQDMPNIKPKYNIDENKYVFPKQSNAEKIRAYVGDPGVLLSSELRSTIHRIAETKEFERYITELQEYRPPQAGTLSSSHDFVRKKQLPLSYLTETHWLRNSKIELPIFTDPPYTKHEHRDGASKYTSIHVENRALLLNKTAIPEALQQGLFLFADRELPISTRIRSMAASLKELMYHWQSATLYATYHQNPEEIAKVERRERGVLDYMEVGPKQFFHFIRSLLPEDTIQRKERNYIENVVKQTIAAYPEIIGYRPNADATLLHYLTELRSHRELPELRPLTKKPSVNLEWATERLIPYPIRQEILYSPNLVDIIKESIKETKAKTHIETIDKSTAKETLARFEDVFVQVLADNAMKRWLSQKETPDYKKERERLNALIVRLRETPPATPPRSSSAVASSSSTRVRETPTTTPSATPRQSSSTASSSSTRLHTIPRKPRNK